MQKLDLKANTIKGTITGIIINLFNLLIPFIIRTIFIRTLGLEYNGLNTLFTSILQVLNLAELGVGTALVFSMYKPIAEKDDNKICALMKLYRTYYRIIGVIILIVGLAITPLLPFIIKSDIPSDINIYIVYFLNLGATVTSYWLFAYKNSILTAYQKIYVCNIITLVVNILKYSFQIIFLIVLGDYYVYLIINLLSQPILNIITAIVANKYYPQFSPKGDISKEEIKTINHKVLNLFAAKVCGVITNSADQIVLSGFLGLLVLGKYNNYYYILTAVMGLFAVFFNSFRPGLGNALITESKQKNIYEFKRLTMFFSLLICISFSCFLNLYQPFIELWVGRESLMSFSSVILLCFYFLSYEYPIFWAVYKDAAGKWREDRARSIIAPIFNLTVNIILVKFIGLNGVLISTIATYGLISAPWLLINIKRYVIDFNLKKYVIELLMYIMCIISSGVVTFILCSFVPVQGIYKLLINFVISTVIPTSIFVLLFRKKDEFKGILSFFCNLKRRKK